MNKKNDTNLIIVPITKEITVLRLCLKVIHILEMIGAIVSVNVVKQEIANNDAPNSKLLALKSVSNVPFLKLIIDEIPLINEYKIIRFMCLG